MPTLRQSERPEAIARAKALPIRKPYVARFDPLRLRDEKLMAVALDMTMRSWRDEQDEPMTNVRLAEILGCAEVIIRGLRRRERQLQGRHLAKMPPDFRDAVLHAFDVVLRVPDAFCSVDPANDVG